MKLGHVPSDTVRIGLKRFTILFFVNKLEA